MRGDDGAHNCRSIQDIKMDIKELLGLDMGIGDFDLLLPNNRALWLPHGKAFLAGVRKGHLQTVRKKRKSQELKLSRARMFDT